MDLKIAKRDKNPLVIMLMKKLASNVELTFGFINIRLYKTGAHQ
jgi:hypothetical protein